VIYRNKYNLNPAYLTLRAVSRRFRASPTIVWTCQLVTMPRPPRTAASGAAAPEPAQPLFEDSDSDTPQLDQPAVLISPIKARAARRDTASKTDIEVWDLSDNEIIGEYLLFSQNGAHSCAFRCFKGYLALGCI
jgi:hypothetical protein